MSTRTEQADISSAKNVGNQNPGQVVNVTGGHNVKKGDFVSAQRRYDNVRVRDSELQKRLCLECGAILVGQEKEYQEHVLKHEAVGLIYQLDCFERYGAAPMAAAENVKEEQQEAPKEKELKKPPQKRKLVDTLSDGYFKNEQK